MNTYKARHAVQKPSTKRRKKHTNVAVIASNLAIIVLTTWLMLIWSVIGLVHTASNIPTDFLDPLRIGMNHYTANVVTPIATKSKQLVVTNINTTSPAEEKMILPMNEDAELEYEMDLAAELVASSEKAQEQQVEEVVVETQPEPEVQAESVVTTSPTESSSTTESIEEENSYYGWTEEDYQYLLMIIVGESQNCSRQEQMYVGSVVLNRVHSSWFPKQNTIKQVATAKGQYACMWDGNAYKTPTETNKEVAMELLKNGSVLPENVVFQALFKQGNGVYCKINKTYFCYK